MLTLRQANNGDLTDHLQALGLISASSYRLWCRRHGFRMDLDKTAAERRKELQHHRSLRGAPTGTSDRSGYIERLAGGEYDGKAVTDFGSRVLKLFGEVEDVAGGRDALLNLLLHVERHGNVLNGAVGFRRLGNTHRNQVMSGLSQLVRFHECWVRPLEDWRPATRKPAAQFRSLAEYLLARYFMPPCLTAAWFEGDPVEAAVQQRWYVHIGSGQNIRSARDLPFPLTKYAAHLFMTSTDSYQPPLMKLRWVQAEALLRRGRTLKLWEIAGHERVRGRANAEFWTSVIHFLLNNPMLERSYIGPLIDYIHYTKFEPRRVPQPDGSVRLEPPVHPRFSIKGRSITKLINEVDDWHAELSGDEYDYVEEWDPCGIGSFELIEDNEPLKARIHWSIQELRTSALLQLEGRLMHHCVGSYAKSCISGEASIWSLRARKDEEDAEQHHVLTIAVDNEKRAITQALGKFNLQPHGARSAGKRRKITSNYRVALAESARIMAIWRRQQGLGSAER